MTHSLHREGTVDSLERDFCMFVYPARGWNTDGVAPKVQRILEVIFLEDPPNLISSTLRKNKYSGVTNQEVLDHVRDNTRVYSTFNNRESLMKTLRRLKEADQGVSIIVSGLVDRVRKIAAEVGLSPHTMNLSLGIQGRTDLLPPPDIRQYTSMCGHGLVSPNMVREAIRKVKAGQKNTWDMSLELAKPCACGIFNPHRCVELLDEMTPLYTVNRW